jgi:hypothetical protein
VKFGEFGEGAVLDLAVGASGFAQENAGRGFAVRDSVNKHGYKMQLKKAAEHDFMRLGGLVGF